MRKVSDPYITGGGLQQFPTTFCTVPIPDGAANALIEPTTTNALTVHPGTISSRCPSGP
ncbi:hypothetical protein [Spirillospora sp. CA-128828]|uniref:hypothetical protein n=1 Tax=Spirillospora sp. CA-128828 TaxID=3240033 RepID=UPI003D9409E0